MARWLDLRGTISNLLGLGIGRALIKGNDVGGVEARNTDDSAFANFEADNITANGYVETNGLNVNDDGLLLNADAAETGSDYSYRLSRPTTGQASNFDLVFPADNPTIGQALLVTSIASGVITTEWGTVAGGTDKVVTDTTTVAFGATSPVTMFTLPANAVVKKVQVIIDTAFNGTAPQLSIGISGTTSKYMGSGQVDLTAAAGTIFEVDPGVAANGSTENLIATYAAGGASAGAARILVDYVIPS